VEKKNVWNRNAWNSNVCAQKQTVMYFMFCDIRYYLIAFIICIVIYRY